MNWCSKVKIRPSEFLFHAQQKTNNTKNSPIPNIQFKVSIIIIIINPHLEAHYILRIIKF